MKNEGLVGRGRAPPAKCRVAVRQPTGGLRSGVEPPIPVRSNGLQWAAMEANGKK